MRKILYSLVLASIPVSALAFDVFVDPRLPVNRINATEFEVLATRGAGATKIWCAGANHAIYRLGHDSGRLYISRSIGPASTASDVKGVVFSTQPIGDVKPAYSVSVRERGANYLVHHAYQFCRKEIRRFHF